MKKSYNKKVVKKKKKPINRIIKNNNKYLPEIMEKRFNIIIVLIAIFFTIIALLLLTCFVAYGNIPDAAVSLCVKAATVISMFSAGFMTARKRRKSGIVSGVIAGSIYVLIMIASTIELMKRL